MRDIGQCREMSPIVLWVFGIVLAYIAVNVALHEWKQWKNRHK